MEQQNAYARGFSLIELLAVLAIVGLITAIVIGSVSASRMKARDLKRIADMKQIQLGLALYFDVNKRYPTPATIDILVTEKYVPGLPIDPLTNNPYEYVTFNSNKNYCIGVELEGPVPADSACPVSMTSNYKATR